MLTMDRGAIGWMVRYARKNLWRVARWHDLDDLLQTGYECFFDSRRRYPTAVDRPHVMRLFQLMYTCRVADMAKASSRQVDFPIGDVAEYERAEERRRNGDGPRFNLADVPCAYNIGTLALAIEMAEPEVQQVLRMIASDPARLAKPHRLKRMYDNEPMWMWNDEHSHGKGYLRRDTLNGRLCRMIGLPDDSLDLVSMIRSSLNT